MKSIWRWAWRSLLLALLALAAVQLWFLGHIWYWTDHNPASTAFMRARLEILREEDPHARLAHQWVAYNRISRHLKQAVIVAEDGKFAAHRGFDWDEMRKAYQQNVREGEIVRGASTITQQLAKNLFLSGGRSWWRKAQEAAITVMLETVMSKRRILEIYLNVIEWGEGVYGAEAAARHHYGVSAAALTAGQAARLAAMVPSPRRYNAGQETPYLARRAATILERMPAAQLP